MALTDTHRGVAIAVFTAGVIAVLALAVSPAAAGTYAIDDGHSLDEESTITEFEDTGYASSDVDGLDMGVSIAEQEADVGIDTPRGDFETTHLCVDYRESIPRTVRIHIPSDYWYPYPTEDEGSAIDETHMDMRASEDKSYSSIEIEFDGRTRACWEIKKQASIYFNAKGWSRDAVENQTGFRPPSISGSADDWNYIPPEAFDEHDGTVGLNETNGSLTLQYDQDPAPHEERWVSVPSCGSPLDGRAAVCKHDDENGEVLLLSQSSNETNVRFKHGTDYRSIGWSGLKDLGATIKRTIESVKSTIGRFFD